MSTNRRHAIPALLILASALAVTGCAASTSSSPSATFTPATTRTFTSNPGSPSAAAASPSASATCTSHACIVGDVEQTLTGLVAKDESVMTKVTCYKSMVKANPGDTYTVSCDVTYSDQEVWSGYATVLAASRR